MEQAAEPWWKQAFAILLGIGMASGLVMSWLRPAPRLAPQWVSLNQMPPEDPKIGIYLIYTASDPPTCYSYGQVNGHRMDGEPVALSDCQDLMLTGLNPSKQQPRFWEPEPIPVWIASISNTKTLIRYGISRKSK